MKMIIFGDVIISQALYTKKRKKKKTAYNRYFYEKNCGIFENFCKRVVFKYRYKLGIFLNRTACILRQIVQIFF